MEGVRPHFRLNACLLFRGGIHPVRCRRRSSTEVSTLREEIMTKSLTTFLGLAALAACSKPSPQARNPGGGDVSSLDACALLTPTEIQQALGVAMKPGVKQ